MYEVYFNQKAILRVIQSFDEFNRNTYYNKIIKCRYEFGTFIYEEKDSGNKSTALCVLDTKTKANENDWILIDDISYRIKKVASIPDINGKVPYYTYYLGK